MGRLGLPQPPARAVPVDPAYFWIKSAYQLVIDYHWLAILKNLAKSQKLKFY